MKTEKSIKETFKRPKTGELITGLKELTKIITSETT